jgi:hypothetical protein
VTSPFAEAAPLIFDLVNCEGFCADDYYLFFQRTLMSIVENNYVICGVIIDNLAAQSLGLRQVLAVADDPTIRAISHVPCFCHAMNLVFANSVRDCGYLQSIMDILSRWEAVFRTRFARRVMKCRPRCPSIPKTRWLYATDPLRWIAEHISDIQTLIQLYQTGEDAEINRAHRNHALDILSEADHIQQFKILDDALRLLEPLRTLCDRLERRNASLSTVIPSVRRALAAYRTLYSARILEPESYEILKHILSRLIARMVMNVQDLSATAYLLSPDGKSEIRMRERGFAIVSAPSMEDQQLLSVRADVHEMTLTVHGTEIHEDAGAMSDSASSDDDQTDEAFETDWDRPDNELEEFSSYQTLQIELFESGDIEHMLAYPLYEDLMLKADGCIASFAEILGFSPDQAVESLHNWISTPSEILRFPLLGNRSVDSIWRNAHQYDAWRDFSEIALRIVTLGTSEADVERIISIHRDIASLKGTRYSHLTIRNRLQLRVSKP